MAESLLIGIAAVAGLILVVAVNVHGKARAFQSADIQRPERRPETSTSVDLPTPQFNRREPRDRRGK